MKCFCLHKLFLRVMIISLCFSYSAFAENVADLEENSQSLVLFGEACERIKPQETTSSIRLRATDKATFDAVKNLNDISVLQNDFNDHDFNVLIYNIVDNFVEDLNVKTSLQNEQKICVEISGFVNPDNLYAAIADMQQSSDKENDTPSYDKENDAPFEQPSQNLAISTVASDIQEPQGKINTVPEPLLSSAQENNKKILLYVAPLEFFNNTSSKEYVKVLSRIFDNNPYFLLTDDENAANYVVSSKLLRAKVDAINSNTNRMQMVLSVTVKNMDNGNSAVEHQNRFILFESSQNEQKVAANLMQKLLTKAGKIILNKVEKMVQQQSISNS